MCLFFLAEKPHFTKMPQDMTIHDFEEFETKVRAEGIPKPTLHWIKDGKQFKSDEAGTNITFTSASETQVASDFSIEHFSAKDAGTVSNLIIIYNNNILN